MESVRPTEFDESPLKMLQGVATPKGEESAIGVGSRLLGYAEWLGKRLVGASGQTVCVDAFIGVNCGADCSEDAG